MSLKVEAQADTELAAQTIIDLEIEVLVAGVNAQGVGDARRRCVEQIVNRTVQVDTLAPIVGQAMLPTCGTGAPAAMSAAAAAGVTESGPAAVTRAASTALL